MYRARQILGILQSRADNEKCKILLNTKSRTRRTFPIPSTSTSTAPTTSISIHANIPSPIIDEKRFALFFSLAAMAILYEQSSTLCQSHHERDEDSAPTIDDTKDAGYDQEDEEKEHCPFCRFFLESPCSETFKVWHECIKSSEKATDCMEPFHPLKVCMDENGIGMGEESDESSAESS